MLGYRRKREAENVREFGLTLTSNSVYALAWKFRPPGSLNKKWGKRRSEKNCILYPIKAVEEQPMYHNSASQCSLCEGKEEGKGIYISMCFVYYRNWSQHAADYLFGTNGQFSVGFRPMRRWAFAFEEF